MNSLNFTRGVNGKPVSSQLLQTNLSTENLYGQCYFGFPLIATPEGKYSIDATLISPEFGVVIFDIVEGTTLGDYQERQDDLVNKFESKLKLHKDLMKGRNLLPKINVITFAPAINLP